jgi:hypothetical protein
VKRLSFAVCGVLTVLTIVSLVAAQSGRLEIPWHTIDGGGATLSTGGDFALSGTVGQPEGGAAFGDVYAVKGGFWKTAAVVDVPFSTVHLPLVVRE